MKRTIPTDPSPLGAPMMTSEEVTRYLRISAGKLKALVNDGEIPAIRVGREIRFRQADIEMWINKNYINRPHHPGIEPEAA